jgi:hypothetical protein
MTLTGVDGRSGSRFVIDRCSARGPPERIARSEVGAPTARAGQIAVVRVSDSASARRTLPWFVVSGSTFAVCATECHTPTPPSSLSKCSSRS